MLSHAVPITNLERMIALLNRIIRLYDFFQRVQPFGLQRADALPTRLEYVLSGVCAQEKGPSLPSVQD